jgi:hypothetical protein
MLEHKGAWAIVRKSTRKVEKISIVKHKLDSLCISANKFMKKEEFTVEPFTRKL